MYISDHQTNLVPLLLKGDRIRCSQICHEYLESGMSVEDLYENVLKKALYEIGRLWEQNKISVTKEHIATAIAEGILNEIYPQIVTNKKNGRRVLLTTVESELHQVGIKMVADVFEKNNWTSKFLGTGVPLYDLIDYINEFEPDVIAISLSIHFNYPDFLHTIKTIRQNYPKIKIIVGGQAFNHIDQGTFADLDFIPVTNLIELEEFIKNYNDEQRLHLK